MFEYLIGYFLNNPRGVQTAMYVCVGLIALCLALWSRLPALIAAAFVMVISCDVSNLVVLCLGYHSVPLIVPAVDGMLATMLAPFALRYRSFPALAVFALFMVEEAVWVTFVYIREGWSIRLIATLNAIYWAQVLLIGAASVKQGMAASITRSNGGAGDLDRGGGGNRPGVAAR
jgi:hypothetical protein